MPHYSGHNPHYDGTGTSGGAVGGYTPPKPPKPEPPKPGAGSGSNTGTSDEQIANAVNQLNTCLLYTSPSPRDGLLSRMPSSA